MSSVRVIKTGLVNLWLDIIMPSNQEEKARWVLGEGGSTARSLFFCTVLACLDGLPGTGVECRLEE